MRRRSSSSVVALISGAQLGSGSKTRSSAPSHVLGGSFRPIFLRGVMDVVPSGERAGGWGREEDIFWAWPVPELLKRSIVRTFCDEWPSAWRFQDRNRECVFGCGAPDGAPDGGVVEYCVHCPGCAGVALRHVGVDVANVDSSVAGVIVAFGVGCMVAEPRPAADSGPSSSLDLPCRPRFRGSVAEDR